MADITLRCADERVNDIAFKKFGDTVMLGELGGVKWHMSRDTMEELFEQIEFCLSHKGSKKLSMISHTDCGLYKELGETDADYEGDLREAKQHITERFPELTVDMYVYDVVSKELNAVEE